MFNTWTFLNVVVPLTAQEVYNGKWQEIVIQFDGRHINSNPLSEVHKSDQKTR